MNELLKVFEQAKSFGVELSLTNAGSKVWVEIYGEKAGPHGTSRSLRRIVSYREAELAKVNLVAMEAQSVVDSLVGEGRK